MRLLFFLSISIVHAKQPAWKNLLYNNTIEKTLLEGRIESFFPLKKSSHPERTVFLVIFANGLKAIFKQRDIFLNQAEVVAYKISNYLNQQLVPPTVIRKIEGKEGSLQLFVESSYCLRSGFNKLNKKNSSDYLLFSYIFGRSDWNKKRNIIIQKNNGRTMIVAIDNERIGMIQKGIYGYGLFLKQHQFTKKTDDKFSFIAPASFNKKIFKELLLDKKFTYIRKKSQNSYITIYDNSLWTRGNNTKYALSYTPHYALSTIEKYRQLDSEILKKIWGAHSFYDNHKEYVDELIKEILIRRDQVLAAVNSNQMRPLKKIMGSSGF